MTETAQAPQFKSEMQKLQFETLAKMISERNALVEQINAANGSKDELTRNVEESDHPQVAELRVKIAELQDQFDAIVEQLVNEKLENAQGDVTALTEQAKEIEATVKPGISYYKKLYDDGTVDALPKIERLKGTRSGGGGAGGRRIRGYSVVIEGDDGSVDQFENFANAAKHLGMDTASLQEMFFAKAGVEKLKDASDTVKFQLNWNDVDEDGNETPRHAIVTATRDDADKDEAPEAEANDEVEPTEDDLAEIG